MERRPATGACAACEGTASWWFVLTSEWVGALRDCRGASLPAPSYRAPLCEHCFRAADHLETAEMYRRRIDPERRAWLPAARDRLLATVDLSALEPAE